MAVENPSYFSLRSDKSSSSTGKTSSFGGFFRRSKRWGSAKKPSTPHPTNTSKNETPKDQRRQFQRQSSVGRSFRSFFRSSNSNIGKAEQFINGNPRPSDVAPPSPYLLHRDQSRQSFRRSLPKTTPNPEISCEVVKEDSCQYENEIEHFTNGHPSYYNISTLPNSAKKRDNPRKPRRHSFSTFAPLDQGSVCTVPTNCPLNRACNTDDVIIVASRANESSTLWINYLTACFEQIGRQQCGPPFRVSQLYFEDPLTPCDESRLSNARLQIVVICPVFLAQVAEHPERAAEISRRLDSARLLAMMLSVRDPQDVREIHRAALVSYRYWKKLMVRDQDEMFVAQLLSAAMSILAGNPATEICDDSSSGGQQSCSGFSIHPKKVKLSQNRVIALLNEPIRPCDEIRVIIDRPNCDGVDVPGVKRRNPYALQFSVPERCLEVSMIVGIKILKNGQFLGTKQVKCESRLRELDQILRAQDNPLEFMCQTFGFHSGDREQLDGWMANSFRRNVPPHFSLLSRPATSDVQINSKIKSSTEENPTLLHFAARFGLEKMAWQLLECPGADIACEMKNVNGSTPGDLAEQAGFSHLAHQLRSFTQMSEFAKMYNYLKMMSEKSNDVTAPSSVAIAMEEPKEKYPPSRPLNQTYTIPPGSIDPKVIVLENDQLSKIVKDFKNEVRSTSEIEQLLEAWKTRDDVKRSVKDKQRQLSVMRDECERIQNNMKAEFQGPSPIDRIKKFLEAGGDCQDVQDHSRVKKSIDFDQNEDHAQRPISSLSQGSVASSASSGKQSLGDSGTHSDADDRYRKPSLITDYQIPPAPKPFRNPLPEETPYYIKYPASGLPVENQDLLTFEDLNRLNEAQNIIEEHLKDLDLADFSGLNIQPWEDSIREDSCKPEVVNCVAKEEIEVGLPTNYSSFDEIARNCEVKMKKHESIYATTTV